MTLAERRTDMLGTLQKLQDTRAKYQTAVVQLTTSIDQLTGAIQMLDQLIAEEGSGDAIGQQGTAALHGDEVRAGAEVEERQGPNGRQHDDSGTAP